MYLISLVLILVIKIRPPPPKKKNKKILNPHLQIRFVSLEYKLSITVMVIFLPIEAVLYSKMLNYIFQSFNLIYQFSFNFVS